MSVRHGAHALVLLAALLVTGCTPPAATPVPATVTPAPPTATRPGYFSRDELIADARPFQIMERFILPDVREFQGCVRVYER